MSHSYVGLQNLDVGYDGHAIIRDICLDIQKGEIVTLIGPNGGGKSTILKSLAKQLEVVRGEVIFDGSPIRSMSYKDLAELMAVVLTERLKTELMTCHDIVATGRYPYTGRLGILSPEDEALVDQALQRVHASELGERDFTRISDGQRQRVMLARAICQQPDIIVLDEPTSFLDIRHKLELLDILTDMSRKDGITVIMSLHEIELARKVSDKILCVGDGGIQGYGSSDQVFRKETITKLFDLTGDQYEELFGTGETGGPETAPRYKIKDGKKLRFGYTTGTCAAAAAFGATELLLAGEAPETIYIDTPKGIRIGLSPADCRLEGETAICGIVKDAGDDPDITDGITVFAQVRKTPEGVTIDGGEGVGRVTRKGLEQPVGNAAINAVPRKMIEEAARKAAERSGYTGGLAVIISAPGGREIAERTFNPRLGIEGGISILGTSGVVEPMSETALIESIGIEIRQRIEEGDKDLVVTLGNYGQAYLKTLDMETSIKCSNFVGEAIDKTIEAGGRGLLFVAHIGKFIKVAAGIMNTHSRNGDGRAEIMAACALRAGAREETVRRVLDTITTDEAISILQEAGVLEQTMQVVCQRIAFYLNKRGMGKLRIEALVFSNAHGYLGETAGFSEYLDEIIAASKGGDPS